MYLFRTMLESATAGHRSAFRTLWIVAWIFALDFLEIKQSRRM